MSPTPDTSVRTDVPAIQTAPPTSQPTPTLPTGTGPCVEGRLRVPDNPASEPAFNLVEGQAHLIAEVARMTGVDQAAVVPSSYGLEQTEIWGSGIAWNTEKLDLSDGTDLQQWFIDLYSGEVITYSQYEACWADLLALGGPFEIVAPAPSFSPGPGLLGIVPGKPYLDSPIDPVYAGYNFRPPEDPPFDGATLADIYARVSPLISTVNGLPYLDIRSHFSCSQVDCQLHLLAWLPNAADPDEWWFEVGHDGSKGELDRDDSWPFPFRAVPHDAAEELLSIVAADPTATAVAAEYSGFAFASWYPKHLGVMSVSYYQPGGLIAGPPMANATTHYLTIKIDIVERRILDYGEVVLDG
jgi:hypothetical protein